MAERLNTFLQENILTLLVHSDEHGKVVANLVDPALFEGDYRIIAERAIGYWQQHGAAPHFHMGDLLVDILEDPNNRRGRAYRQILQQMLQLSEGINAKYVLSQLTTFTRMQQLKDAILKSAERLNSQQELAVSEVENIWNNLLHTSSMQFDPGTYLLDYEKMLAYMAVKHSEFTTGVDELNKRNIIPFRGGIFLLLGPAKAGKTWGLVDIGKRALIQRKKVLHISLEMSEEEVQLRYYQSLFAVPKREGKVKVTSMSLDKLGMLKGFEEEEVLPDFTFSSPSIHDELRTRVLAKGNLFKNLLIKRFPPRSLDANGLRGFLDNVEVTEKFIPDILVLDYVGIMKTDAKNHRISLGRQMEEVRAVCVERNIAGATAHQISREGTNAAVGSSTHIAEDWSMIGTADIVVVLAVTEAERAFGLARLYVTNARSEQDRFSVLITQNYSIGQFCLSSTFMRAKYFDQIKELTGGKEDESESSDEQ